MNENKITKVKKRNGSIVDFESAKIAKALFKALTATGQGDEKISKKISNRVVEILNRRFKQGEVPQVEQIQDIVEEVLILENLIKTAKAYILYREKRRVIRDAIKVSDEAVDRIDQYLDKLDWEVKENANMAFSLQGMNHYGVSYITKKYWLNKIYPKEIREANESGDIHIHNLDTLGAYCSGWDLYDLLLRGFGGVSGKMESKPPKHFRAALGQVVNFLFTIQGEVAGAIAFSNFDTLLAPFIRYDNLNYKQVKQALQEFLFNMATPTRVGFQNPFSNITLDLRPSPVFEKQPILIGGKPQKETYGEFRQEMEVFDKALYETMLEGDKSGRPFHFPIPTINITKDFPWNEEAFNPMFEASAKYGTNYFANYINSDMKPEDVRSMCKLPSTQIIYKNANNEIAKTEIRRIVDDFIRRNNPIKVLVNGGFKTVKDIVKLRLENEEILKLTLDNGLIDKMTLDHPSLVIKNGKLQVIESRNLKIGDEFPVAKYPYEGELGDFDLGRVVGLYAGDGWISHNGATLNYVFGHKEEKLIEFVQKISKNRFAALPTVFLNKQHKYCKISIASKSLVELIREYVRAGNSLSKRLNSKTYARSIEFRKGVLIGLIESDGFVHYKANYIIIHLGNKDLILDILMLSRTLGINSTYFESKNKTGDKEKTGYSLRFAGDIPEWLRGYFKTRKGRNFKYNDYSDFYGIKIVKIEKYKYTGFVYDFEIDSKEHCFQLANGIMTHNCCRLRLNLKELYNRGGGGLFGSGALTGSIGVVTINMPRIGYTSKTKKEFLDKLGKNMDLAKDSLLIKRKTIENFIDKGLYPFSKFYLSGIKKARNAYYANHFSTIGLTGMNECLLNFLGKDMGSKQGVKFTLEVMNFMRDKLVKYQNETNSIYNLEATPAESTSYRFAMKDREKYPDIITSGTKKVPYYTNSTQLPVGYTSDIFEALNLQDEIQCKYTGGCIEKENKVLTNKGLLNIEYIVKNFNKLAPIKALSYNKKLKISEWDKVLKAIKVNVEKHNKIRVKGERNLDIVTSDWHPFFVLEKFKPNLVCPICKKKIKNIKAFATHIRWNLKCKKGYQAFPKYQIIEKRADKLKVGDYILQNSDNLYPDKTTALDNDLMWLIGFFIGDGCISEYIDNRGGKNLKRYKVRFFSEHQEALEKISKILKKYFQCEVAVIQNDKRSVLLKEIATSKHNVIKFFFDYDFNAGKKVYNISISKKVKENISRNNIYALLSGLIDSDGHIDTRDGGIEYYTVSNQLASDILEICNVAGIIISKSLKPTKRKNEVDIWRLKIPSYETTRIKKQLINSFHIARIKNNLSNRKKRRFPVVRVKSVSKVNVKDEQFYDLTTQKNHNYLAGKNCLVFIHNTVHHLFLGEEISDIQITKNLIKKIFEKYHLPYITLTPTFSICPVHGYLSGKHWTCPKCVIEQPCEVYSRIVGYYRPVKQYNVAKQQEFKDRKEFEI
jgi:ribonucleoside-triphosphate reductase